MIIEIAAHAVERYMKRIDKTATSPEEVAQFLMKIAPLGARQGKAGGRKGGDVYEYVNDKGTRFRYVLIQELSKKQRREHILQSVLHVMTTVLPAPHLSFSEVRSRIHSEAQNHFQDLKEELINIDQGREQIGHAYHYVAQEQNALASHIQETVKQVAKRYEGSQPPPIELKRIAALKKDRAMLGLELSYLSQIYAHLDIERLYLVETFQRGVVVDRWARLVQDTIKNRMPLVRALVLLYRQLEAAGQPLDGVNQQLRELLGSWDFDGLQGILSAEDPLSLSDQQLQLLQIEAELRMSDAA